MTATLRALFALLPLCGASAAQTAAAGFDPTAPPALPAPEDVLMLRLRDGSIRWGAIESHDPDGVHFLVLSHGGRVDVPWSLMDPSQELELRTRYGYVDVSSEELMVDAERLVLKTGGEVVGVIESREGASFMVAVSGNLQQIPKQRVASVQSGLRVPALDVYSREEMYRRLATAADSSDVASLVALARDCERILDFTHAVQHYGEALAIDPQHGDGAVAASLAAARIKAEQQEQIEYLREVDLLRRKGLYDRALALAAAFGETFPGSSLIEDANKKRVTVLEARDKAITAEVARQWHHYASRFARDAAGKLSFAEAQVYAGERLGEEVLQKVTEIVQNKISSEIQPDHVRQYWEQRKKGRWQLASYGLGTWLLGEEAAQRGLKDEPEEEALSQLDRQREALGKKIEQYLKNREQARKARTRQDEGENFELFWQGWGAGSRAQWIRAYYVEYGGDMEVRDRPRFSNCSDCGGTGAREVVYVGGGGSGGGQGGNPGSQIVECPVCHGVQIVRRVYYR